MLGDLAAASIMSAGRARPDVAALDSQKATLLDGAPLCAAVLDTNGRAVVVNKVFVELMGPLFKFSNHEFSEAASKIEGKASLKAAIKAVCSGASTRERLSNIEMLTHARWPCMPVKAHFDWFIGSSEGPRDVSLCWRGHAVLYGYPCSPEVEQPEKDAELFNCFRNEPIARLWLSGSESLSRRGSDNNDYYDDDDDDEDEDEDEEWGAKRVGRKSKGSTRWPVGPSRGAAIQKRVPPTVTAAATWEIAELVGMVVDEVALVATHPCVHAAPRVPPTSTRAAAPVTSPVGAAETKSVPVPVHYEVQHAAPRVDDVSVEDPSLLPSEPHTVSAKSDELLDQLLLPRGMMYSVYAV